MASKMSSRNPFRTPAATPNPTGASISSSVPPYSSVQGSAGPPSYSDPHSDDEETPEALPDLTPRIPSASPSRLVAQSTGRSTSRFSPPPSLPPRPSSSNPAPRLSSNGPSIDDDSIDGIPDTAPPAYSVAPNVGGGELVVEQGPRRPFQRAPEPFLQLPAPQNQQQEQGQQQLQSSRPQSLQLAPPPGPPDSTPARPQSQLSDFARDFYSAGPTPPAVQQPEQPRFAPPPRPPPPRRPRAASTSRGAGSIAPPMSDGRPTTTPTPGHPLLRNGKTLVYPENYLCPKCQNTGYKNFDPSHPCRKCWDRFSKLFTSILASSPWAGQGSGSTGQSERGRTFQRPLPAFKPPTQVRPPLLQPMPGSYPTYPTSSPTRGPNSQVVPLPDGNVPPVGATVVMPGDPRIGGRICWRCGGRGVTPFLIFDEETCDTCGGIGRLMN